MAGCVTHYSGGTQMSSDLDAKLDKRVTLALEYIGVGDWENLKRNLELAQEVDPNKAEVFEAFVLVYQSTGGFEMAETNSALRSRQSRHCPEHSTTTRLFCTAEGALSRRSASFIA